MVQLDQKLVGAFVVGMALVAGAYLYTTFGSARTPLPTNSQAAAPIRAAIPVTDNDGNGIEDWRDAFTANKPVQIGEPSATYTLPTTLTGQLGINLFQDYVRAKNYGPFGKTQEEIVTETVKELARDTEQTLYSIGDISVLSQWQDEDIRNYGNIMGASIMQNSQTGLESELVILTDIIGNGNTERASELAVIAGFYKTMRDQALATPVPSKFIKEHLDLINVYEALYQDISAMQVSTEDPAVTLLRFRRYQDDVLGLELALQNMYRALEPHASLFTATDPALIFSTFTSNTARP